MEAWKSGNRIVRAQDMRVYEHNAQMGAPEAVAHKVRNKVLPLSWQGAPGSQSVGHSLLQRSAVMCSALPGRRRLAVTRMD